MFCTQSSAQKQPHKVKVSFPLMEVIQWVKGTTKPSWPTPDEHSSVKYLLSFFFYFFLNPEASVPKQTSLVCFQWPPPPQPSLCMVMPSAAEGNVTLRHFQLLFLQLLPDHGPEESLALLRVVWKCSRMGPVCLAWGTDKSTVFITDFKRQNT